MPVKETGKEDIERFSRTVRPSIERYITKRVRNRDHADEIVSRVFEALARTWSSFRGDCPTEAYAMHIAANALKNYYSRDLQKLSRQISLDEWVESYSLQHDPNLVCPYNRLETVEWVRSLMSEMNRSCSQAECGVMVMYYRGNTFEEISTLLGLNAATVRGHFLRARKKLLVHILQEAPHLLGGEDNIRNAVARINTTNPGLLDKEELAAIETRGGSAEVLRRAMAKIAPYLDDVL